MLMKTTQLSPAARARRACRALGPELSVSGDACGGCASLSRPMVTSTRRQAGRTVSRPWKSGQAGPAGTGTRAGTQREGGGRGGKRGLRQHPQDRHLQGLREQREGERRLRIYPTLSSPAENTCYLLGLHFFLQVSCETPR